MRAGICGAMGAAVPMGTLGSEETYFERPALSKIHALPDGEKPLRRRNPECSKASAGDRHRAHHDTIEVHVPHMAPEVRNIGYG